MKTIVLGKEAYDLYVELTNHEKFTRLQKELEAKGMNDLGLIWIENGIIVAADFCKGCEIFIEEFDNILEAARYASGLKATTRGGQYI